MKKNSIKNDCTNNIQIYWNWLLFRLASGLDINTIVDMIIWTNNIFQLNLYLFMYQSDFKQYNANKILKKLHFSIFYFKIYAMVIIYR